jgi:hypothetical protein
MVSNTILAQTPVVFKALDDLGGVGFGEVFGRPRSHPTCHWVAVSYSWVIKSRHQSLPLALVRSYMPNQTTHPQQWAYSQT